MTKKKTEKTENHGWFYLENIEFFKHNKNSTNKIVQRMSKIKMQLDRQNHSLYQEERNLEQLIKEHKAQEEKQQSFISDIKRERAELSATYNFYSKKFNQIKSTQKKTVEEQKKLEMPQIMKIEEKQEELDSKYQEVLDMLASGKLDYKLLDKKKPGDTK